MTTTHAIGEIGRVKTVRFKYKHSYYIYWIRQIGDKRIIYGDKCAFTVISHSSIQYQTSFELKLIPTKFESLYKAVTYYHNVITKLSNDSFESAELGSKLSFAQVMVRSDLCLKYSKELHQHQYNKMSIETKQFAIKLLKNWNQNNDLNKFGNSDKDYFYLVMANLLHQMSFQYAKEAKMDKALLFCKQASSYINLSNCIPSTDLKHLVKYNQLSKFNSLSTMELIHINEFEIGNAFTILYD